MQSRKPLISVIIPAYNEEKYIADCVKSVTNQDFDKNHYEVIVVDNASTDKTAEIAKKYGAKVVNQPKKGNTFARIKGVEVAKGQIFAFTDADCRVPKNWLSKFLEDFKKDPKVVAIGGVFTMYDGKPFTKWFVKTTQRLVYHISGGCSAIRKESFEKVGGFDPNISLGEDVLLHFKLKKIGRVVIDYSLVVETSARRMNNNLPKTLFMYTNDIWIRLFQKQLFKTFEDIR